MKKKVDEIAQIQIKIYNDKSRSPSRRPLYKERSSLACLNSEEKNKTPAHLKG